jgi:hypothetical protein
MSVTVQVKFAYTWLTNPADPTNPITAPNPVRSGQVTLGGRFATYAGGRIRVITTPDDTRNTKVVLQDLDDDDLNRLDSWRGTVLLLRDAAGWRKWGSFLDLTWTDVGHAADGTMTHDATFMFTEVTYIEGT